MWNGEWEKEEGHQPAMGDQRRPDIGYSNNNDNRQCGKERKEKKMEKWRN